jgi:hypothetical protein
MEGRFTDAEFLYGPVSVIVMPAAHIDYETYCSAGALKSAVLAASNSGRACSMTRYPLDAISLKPKNTASW